MRLNKKAFVLLETIVVITVLSVTLIVLYASYSKIISDSRKKMFYDNTEYIYKTQYQNITLSGNNPGHYRI